ncbi:MAG: S66 peptidase family protein [Patescibacteria group bacterium]
MIAKKLKPGDHIRVIAPANSLSDDLVNKFKKTALQNFKKMGLRLSFSNNAYELDEFNSSSLASRLSDLHEAFADKSVKMIIAVCGGFNSNQLLKYIDYDLIKKNPKIFCGYSDITALSNAIFAKTALVTYSGPDFLAFGEALEFKYTANYFKKCLFSPQAFTVKASLEWEDAPLRSKPTSQKIHQKNNGFWLINEGKAQGQIIGGNQCTLNLLQGTEFMPELKNKILFLEDDYEAHVATIDRDLQSLIHLPDFKKVKALVFGRLQIASGMSKELFTKIIKTKKELNSIPVIANVDFGHTAPLITFPIGGTAKLSALNNKIKLEIIKH